MGLGGATRKLQKVADMGEELYGRMNELLEQVIETQETVNDTNRRIAAIENRLDQQGELLEALAEQQGIDVEALLTEVAIEDAEAKTTDAELVAESEQSPSEGDVDPIPDAEVGGDVSAGSNDEDEQ